jgi:hypothetical protein
MSESAMNDEVRTQVAALERMTVTELKGRYAEVFVEPTRENHKQYLIKRIVWRMPALAPQHPDRAGLGVHVLGQKGQGLRDPQPRPMEERQQGPVAQPRGPVPVAPRQEAQDLARAQDLGGESPARVGGGPRRGGCLRSLSVAL